MDAADLGLAWRSCEVRPNVATRSVADRGSKSEGVPVPRTRPMWSMTISTSPGRTRLTTGLKRQLEREAEASWLQALLAARAQAPHAAGMRSNSNPCCLLSSDARRGTPSSKKIIHGGVCGLNRWGATRKMARCGFPGSSPGPDPHGAIKPLNVVTVAGPHDNQYGATGECPSHLHRTRLLPGPVWGARKYADAMDARPDQLTTKRSYTAHVRPRSRGRVRLAPRRGLVELLKIKTPRGVVLVERRRDELARRPSGVPAPARAAGVLLKLRRPRIGPTTSSGARRRGGSEDDRAEASNGPSITGCSDGQIARGAGPGAATMSLGNTAIS